jgi:hypothetical protein
VGRFCASVTLQPTLRPQGGSERPAVRFAAAHTNAGGSSHAKTAPARSVFNRICDVLCDVTRQMSRNAHESAEQDIRSTNAHHTRMDTG